MAPVPLAVRVHEDRQELRALDRLEDGRRVRPLERRVHRAAPTSRRESKSVARTSRHCAAETAAPRPGSSRRRRGRHRRIAPRPPTDRRRRARSVRRGTGPPPTLRALVEPRAGRLVQVGAGKPEERRCFGCRHLEVAGAKLEHAGRPRAGGAAEGLGRSAFPPQAASRRAAARRRRGALPAPGDPRVGAHRRVRARTVGRRHRGHPRAAGSAWTRIPVRVASARHGSERRARRPNRGPARSPKRTRAAR